jgi:deoxyribodipyrimidine photo-lyase
VSKFGLRLLQQENYYSMDANIAPERIKILNQKPVHEDGRYVLYWMQQSQRSRWNHALEYAIAKANELDCGVIVGFGLMDDYPEANARHYTFMLEGLQQLQEGLDNRKCKFVLRYGHPAAVALELGQSAKCIVCDRGYLRHQRAWRGKVAEEANCQVIQVECDAVVPVEEASDKQEYAARTIRKKLMGQYEDFLEKPNGGILQKDSRSLQPTGESLEDIPAMVERMNIDHSVTPVSMYFQGGEQRAAAVFERFLQQHFSDYSAHRNQPQTDDVSYMSMYLHFGHIAPAHLLQWVRQVKPQDENREGFVEELLVRRELGINFCYYTEDYDRFGTLPGWAQQTLAEHSKDERDPAYTLEELENAQTHDPYWNAAMLEMKHTGYMHNYMRMYWGKQILAWSPDPKTAYDRTLHLNNKYFLDGRDCNSFANVSWVFGQHDRGWTERPVFGKVRIMKQSGLKRKMKPDQYVEKVARLTGIDASEI